MSTLDYRKSRSGEPTEDELRQRRFGGYKRRQIGSQHTDDTGSTIVVDAANRKSGADEFGLLKLPDMPETPLNDYFDPYDDTLLASPSLDYLQRQSAAINGLSPHLCVARRSDLLPRSVHHRTLSGGLGANIPSSAVCALKSKQLRDSMLADVGIEPGPGTLLSMTDVGRRRFGSVAGSPMSFDTRGEYSPRAASCHSHRRSGSAANVVMRGNPPHTLVTIPEPVFAVEPVRARTGPLADRFARIRNRA